jgi:hypothetical protein
MGMGVEAEDDRAEADEDERVEAYVEAELRTDALVRGVKDGAVRATSAGVVCACV